MKKGMNMRVSGADDSSKIQQTILLLAQEQVSLKQMFQQHVQNMNQFKDTALSELRALKATVDNITKNMSSAGNCSVQTSVLRQKPVPPADDSEDDNDPNVNRKSERKSQKQKSGFESLTTDSVESQSPVQLNSNPPRNVPKPLPKKTGSHSKNNQDYDALFEVSSQPVPGQSLLVSQPQESDFIKLMRSLGMEINPSTIQSVCSAVKGLTGAQNKRAPGLNTVVVLDISESMKGKPWQTAKSCLNKMLDEVDNSARQYGLEEQIAVITCCRATGVVPFTNDYVQIRNLLGHLSEGGRTPLMTALTLALCYLELHGSCVKSGEMLIYPRVIILSDFDATLDVQPFEGQDSDTSSDRIKVQRQLFSLADKYAARNYDVVCVPVGSKNDPVVQEFAKKSLGRVIDESDRIAARDVALHYRYKLCVGRALNIYDVNMKRDHQETDVYGHLIALLPRVGLGAAHQESAVAMLEKELQDDDDMESIEDVANVQIDTKVMEHEVKTNGFQEVQAPIMTYQAHQESQTSTEVTRSQAGSNTSKQPQGRKEPPELPRWTHTKNADSISLEEQSGLLTIGSRVRRGKDWRWANQDSEGPGTVVGHKDKGLVFVLWDNNQIGAYRYGFKGENDVQKVKEPRVVGPGEIEVGCNVVRGQDWERGDEDGGKGTVGVVIRKLRNRYVMVRWPSRVVDTYRFGADDKWELEVTQADNSSFEGPDISTPEASTALQPPATASTRLFPWWSFQDNSKQWRPFTADGVEKLESKKEAGHEHCIIDYQGNSAKCFLEQNKCELGGKMYPMKREMMKEEDIQSMIALQEFIPPLS